MTTELSAPVRRYLEELEPLLKSQVGVVPEDALSDAREFLQASYESLQRSEPGQTDDEVYELFVSTFGSPEQVAQGYADDSSRFPLRLPKGFAPGWRICCTRCGRSAPAAKVGIIRIGARSYHKYTLGWCSSCRRLRFLRLIRDLDKANLTSRMGVDVLPEDLRRSMHRPKLVIVGVVALAVCLSTLIPLLTVGHANPTEPFLQKLPDGWTVEKSIELSRGQRESIEDRLDISLEEVRNSFLSVNGQTIQINTMRTQTGNDAVRLAARLRKEKQQKRLVQHRGRTVTEIIARTQADLLLAWQVRYRLGIQPARVTYRVTFEAAPLKSCDPMEWNTMFNHFLRLDAGDRTAKKDIQALSPRFMFDSEIQLRRDGLGRHASRWTLVPEPESTRPRANGELLVHQFGNLATKAGVPFVSLSGTIVSETSGFIPTERQDVENLTAETSRWPVSNQEVRDRTAKITNGLETDREKVQALLDWLVPGKNLRYDGQVTGSRYGVQKTMNQGFGHCWDFSDVFVTHCRASGVPCRQVLGWLHHESGHVWAEVLISGEGWRQVDPTGATWCGSDYIPLLSTEDGEISLLYVSRVNIEVLDEEGSALQDN